MTRILFAHPDPKFSQIYISHLKRHFDVDSAHDGLAALRMCKMTAPSLIVSEYYLPLISGISLLKFVRNEPKFATVPFVFLSHHTDNAEALSLGANDWIDIKSTHPDSLLDRIFHHLKVNRYVQIN